MASAVSRKDKRLKRKDRAVLSDYAYSGYDKGHMVPSGDMVEDDEQQESFALTNVVPQVKDLNRGEWEKIELAVRRAATRLGKLYIVTGPKFDDLATSERIVKSDVIVPAYTWKAVYDVSTGRSWGYICTNNDVPVCRNEDVSEIARFTGQRTI